MILTGREIAREVGNRRVMIDPFDAARVNPNSYNLRLGDSLRMKSDFTQTLDMRWPAEYQTFYIPERGVRLSPGRLYLAHTREVVGSEHFVPEITGRSSVGRLGLFVHVTAGFGDVGFYGQWTLELTCVEPLVIYPGTEICQVIFHEVKGIRTLYKGKYQGQMGACASRLYTEIERARHGSTRTADNANMRESGRNM